MEASAFIDKTNKDVDTLVKEQAEALGIIKRFSEHWHFHANSFIQNSHKDIDTLSKKYSISKEINKADPPFIQSYWYFGKESSCIALHNWDELYHHSKKHVELMESNPDVFQEKTNAMIGALNNLIIACLRKQKHQEALFYILKIRQLKSRWEITRIKIFSMSYNLELFLRQITGDFAKGILLTEEIEKGLEEHKDKIVLEHKLLLYYSLFANYFGAGEFAKSLSWINKIVNRTNLKIRNDIQCFARIMNLFVHYELGNDDLFDYLLKSNARLLKKNDNFYLFENTIIHCLKKLNRARGNVTKQQLILDDTLKWMKRPENKNMMQAATEFFDFISWFESKTENRSFSEVLRKKTA